MDRRQQRQLILSLADPAGSGRGTRDQPSPSGSTSCRAPRAWWGERLLTVEVSDDTYRLFADGNALTPEGLQVRGVVDVDDDAVLILGGVRPG